MKSNIQRLITEVTLEELQLHIIECLSNERQLCLNLVIKLLSDLLDHKELAHPLARINPQELTTSLVQDAVVQGVTDISKYLYIKEKLTELDGVLNSLELFVNNPFFLISKWEEMVVTIASKITCSCKRVQTIATN